MGIAGQPVGWFYHRKAEDMFVALESEEPKEAVKEHAQLLPQIYFLAKYF